MTPQLLAMLNGMYGGVPNDTDGIMPLGSGFAGQSLPPEQTIPQSGGGGLQMPNMPLGSGMYGMGTEAQPQGNFAVGSGLYGQQMPQASDMQQQGGQPQQANAQPTAESGMDKFSQLMNNPMFQYGMGLVGAMHTTNPWGGGMQAFLQAQGQQAKIKQANAAMLAEQQRIKLAQQEAALHQRQYEEAAPQREATLGQTQAGTGMVTAQTAAIPSEMAAREAGTAKTIAETGAIPVHSALETAQGANLAVQGQLEQQKIDMAKRQMAMQDPVYQLMLKQLGIGGGTPQLPVPQPAAPGMQPQSFPDGGATGKFGTPVALLDGIQHVESGGNPNAVNPESGATGAYQFMPGTVNMLANQGFKFDPRDPQQSRDAADYYMQMLMKQNGGDMNKALAAYGGFKTKDPTPYINKVMTAAGQMPQPQQQPVQPSAGGSVGGMDPIALAKTGALADFVGMKGGGFTELGKMMQPQNVPAGGYQRNAQTGELTYVPDPMAIAKLHNETQSTAANVAHINQETTMAKGKVAETQAADRQTLQDSTASLDRLAKGAQALVQFDAKGNVINQHPGLEHNAGWQGLFGVQKVSQSGRDAAAQIDMLKNQLMVDTMGVLRSASKSGSTGMGQLNQSEGDTLRGVIANLQTDKGQSLKQLQQQLKQVQEFAVGAKQRMAEKYNSLYANENNPNVAPSIGANTADVGQPAQAASGGVIDLKDFLASKRKK